MSATSLSVTCSWLDGSSGNIGPEKPVGYMKRQFHRLHMQVISEVRTGMPLCARCVSARMGPTSTILSPCETDRPTEPLIFPFSFASVQFVGTMLTAFATAVQAHSASQIYNAMSQESRREECTSKPKRSSERCINFSSQTR